jgi:polyisoprenoid-binding protein YceI
VAAAVFALSTPVHAQNAPVDATRLRVAPQGNEVRYRVREQLLNIDFPSDAIGKTGKIDGEIAVDAKGAVLNGSRFTIDLVSLTATGATTSSADKRCRPSSTLQRFSCRPK